VQESVQTSAARSDTPSTSEVSLVPEPPNVRLTGPRVYQTHPLPAWAHPRPYEPGFAASRSSRFLIAAGVGMMAAALTHLPFARRSICQPGPRSRPRTVHLGAGLTGGVGFALAFGGGITLALARRKGADAATKGQIGAAFGAAAGAYSLTSLALMLSLIGSGWHTCADGFFAD